MKSNRIAFFDVETPNHRQNCICSIGIIYEDEIGDFNEFYTLVNPECEFDAANTYIHGITSKDVIDAPTFPEVWNTIHKFFSNCLVVGHNVRFDLCCIKKALKFHGIEAPNPYYVDTLDISRSLINDIDNHKLNTLCNYFGIELLRHHDALEDAKATAQLFHCLNETHSIDINEYIRQYDFSDIVEKTRKKQFEFSDDTKYLQELQGIVFGIMCDDCLTDEEVFALKYWMDTHKALKGNYPFDRIYQSLTTVLEDNVITEEERSELMRILRSVINPMETETPCVICADLEGKTICLTGEFSSMNRKDFESFLNEHGAIVKKGVSKKLHYLVVGDLGSDQWAQGNYGTKIKKAMEYNERGGDIVIVKESDFLTIFEL
nr:exonuclease domain-containing protein [uncultured Ruminococcus sp.]